MFLKAQCEAGAPAAPGTVQGGENWGSNIILTGTEALQMKQGVLVDLLSGRMVLPLDLYLVMSVFL